MSKSNNRHPVESYPLVDTPRLWHVSGPVLPPLGCQGCQERGLCGGLQVQTSIYDCLTFCRCVDPRSCDNVCPRNMRNFVARSQEVRGFNLENTPRTQDLLAPKLETVVPLIYHGSSRDVPLNISAVAIPLAKIFTRAGARRFQTRARLFDYFKIDARCQLIVSGTDEDPSIERWWGMVDREAMIRDLRDLGVAMITVPNYSLFADVPRHDNLYNMKRIALSWSEFQREGLVAALHVNARTDRDWERWTDFVGSRLEVSSLAFEFGTGAGARSRIAWHVEHLSRLARHVGRPLTLVVRGGLAVLPTLREAFYSVTFIDTAPFVKTQRRQRALIDGDRLRWQTAPTADGEPLDELLLTNIVTSAAYVSGRQAKLMAASPHINAPEVALQT